MSAGVDRRGFLKRLGLGLGAVALAGRRGVSAAETRKPNIIYIMVDDLGYGDLGCFGQKIIETPRLDQMAAEGMKMTQHYAGATVCAPSRCILMTGYHGGRAYIRGNSEVQPEGQAPLPAGTFTIAHMLKAAGYATGAAGKWGLGGPESEGHPNRQGFDYFYGYLCQRQAHRFYPTHLWRNEARVVLEGNEDGGRQVYSHALIVDEALDFIRRHHDAPFFLYLPITIPHAELHLPEEDMERYRGRIEEAGPFGQPAPYGFERYNHQPEPRTAFAAMVTRMDADVGQVFDLLKELDLDRDTLVIFTSDNGPHKEGGADPDFFQSGGPFRGHKRDLYEGGIRVPTIAWWPGKIAAGSESDHISAFWDVAPTFAEVVGVEPPDDIDGISFLPALLGRPQQQHDSLYFEFHEQGGKQAARKGDWKAVRLNVNADPDGPIELYNLATDPGETTDVAEAHPDIVREMATIMAEAHEPSAFPRWNFRPAES